ncbi:MAG: hypothetical protein KKA65_02610 [Nanoarchaeota archaeon]|nr:hypothetical protein [Nanoarchaeota archaeon]MBU4241786.1 hypothetical protein [Nanoarchaeota archaeon]MBU4352054.1 hypothetical protein [Nanoarchaeota archaeon]MBU4456369.1 hypothetical protein [Nanoarchaeota archaeon]MCG2720181.1 hypothetical protein [Nanoarchaeota archaeon]
MKKKIDISDLLKVDKRLPFNWRFAKIERGKLHLQFPDSGYNVETRVEDKVMYLDVKIEDSLALKIQDYFTLVPKGIEIIIYGDIKIGF